MLQQALTKGENSGESRRSFREIVNETKSEIYGK